MIVGYVRVSTQEQNEARQLEAMKAYGAERIFSEKVSGKNANRPQLKAMLDFVRSGDTLVVESYSRLARSTFDLLTIIGKLDEKGVAFVSLKESIDTASPQGRLMLTIFAGLAQFERECILERQREGIECAKKAGRYKGRKPIDRPENWDAVIKAWKDGEITAVVAQRKLNLTPATFYRKVRVCKELA